MIEILDTSKALERELALLEEVSRNPDQRHLWFWESPRCLVAPMNLKNRPLFKHASEQMLQEGWQVNVRSTGGDVTPQGPGIINLSHIYANPPGSMIDLKEEYDKLCAPIEKALGQGASRGWQSGAFCDGAYNVQWNGLKFAGTAMRIRRCKTPERQTAVLAHAIMLTEAISDEAIEAINRFLSLLGEERQIDIAAHSHLPQNIGKEEFTDRLTSAFDEQMRRIAEGA